MIDEKPIENYKPLLGKPVTLGTALAYTTEDRLKAFEEVFDFAPTETPPSSGECQAWPAFVECELICVLDSDEEEERI